MKVTPIAPPRRFTVGASQTTLSECAKISLMSNELVTFVTPGGSEHDVTRKDWGFYATQSLNSRLPSCGLHPYLIHGNGKYFIVLVEPSKVNNFKAYLEDERLTIIARLDNEGDLKKIQNTLLGSERIEN